MTCVILHKKKKTGIVQGSNGEEQGDVCHMIMKYL